MFSYSFVLKETSSNLTLSFPLLKRILLSSIAACLLFVIIFSEGTYRVFPAVLFVISAVAAGYFEVWIFSRGKGEIITDAGFLIFKKRKRIPFDEIDYMKLSTIVRGKNTGPDTDIASMGRHHQKQLVKLLLVQKDGSQAVIEIVPFKQKSRMVLYAEKIAEYTGVRLTTE